MALQVSSLTKSYNDKKALNEFTFSISEGEIVGLVGKNGAGKTTLLNCIAGNIFPDKGEILFDNVDLLKNPILRKEFGILIQPCFLDYLNTYDNLKLLQNSVGIWEQKKIKENSDKVLKIVGLEGKGKSFVKSFSFGMKQRLGFAQALLNGKKFLILDEPFVGLDINGREIVKKYIKKIAKEKKIGVIFSDHNLDEVRSLCERVIVINDGKKVYDKNIFEEKKYIVNVQNIDEKLEKQMECIEDVRIEKDNAQIFFSKNNNIQEIMSVIVNNTTILDIKIIENNLEKLINGENV